MNILKIPKQVKSPRTYKFKLRTDSAFIADFNDGQRIQLLYFNYGLKYLHQHYGVGHLKSWFPTGVGRKYLISKMINFARNKSITHGFDLKANNYNTHATNKMLDQLCINFNKYRRGQYIRINYWPQKDTEKYLRKHNCALTGYGRISYKHDLNKIRSISLKQDHNQIYKTSNFRIHLPHFKFVRTYKSMSVLNNKEITEAKIIHRQNNDFELQVVVKFEKRKDVSSEDINNIVGLDVNLKDDKFFALSNGNIYTWPKNVKHKYTMLDNKARYIQDKINCHNNGRDNSRELKYLQNQLSKLKAKAGFIIDDWQLKMAKRFSTEHVVFAMEQLNSFDLRMSKRYNKKFRNNTNNKLAKIQPSTFRKTMENVYENDGHLLYEVNTIDTSKTCNECGYINHDLQVSQREWTCPACGKELNRDLNATYNIRDWAVNPDKHAVLQQPNRFKYLKKSDLVIEF